MTLLHLLILAVIQGLTEFLPVSSSAHLILVSWALKLPDQGLVTDVAIHFGTLLAVVYYFRADLVRMCRAVMGPAGGGQGKADRQLLQFIVLASVPVVIAGLLAHAWIEAYLRDVRVIAASTIVFGLLLWYADAHFPARRGLADLTLRSALAVGLAQVLALVPGVSRSGVTLTMGRMLGFDAVSAARFSFLLAIPVLAAAGAYGMWRVMSGGAALDWGGFAVAVTFSALAGWICIAAFLALLERFGLLPFVIYRLLLGVVLLIIVL